MKKICHLLTLVFLPVLISSAQNIYTYDKSKIHFKTKRIVQKVAKLNNLNEGNGFSYWKAKDIQKFDEIATVRECIELTNHPNPMIRYCSFEKLTIEKYTDLTSILENHKNDSAYIHYSEFCMGYSYSVYKMMKKVKENNDTLTYEKLHYKFIPKTADDYYNVAIDLYEDVNPESKRSLRKADKKAKKYLLTAIKLDSTNAYCYYQLGIIDYALNKHKSSKKAMDNALKYGYDKRDIDDFYERIKSNKK
jgi:hypothetical protein